MSVQLLPASTSLTQTATHVLGILLFTVALWIFQVINNGVASILMMALMILASVPASLALSGFASPQFWILLCVLFYGHAMRETGLAKRFSCWLLTVFPGTYAGILLAFFVAGLVLALGIPSMTVRTAIMVPVADALVKSLELPKRSRSSALILVTTIEMAVIPGCAFLYGSLFGPVVDSVFQAKHLELRWTSYAGVMTFPTIVLCLLLIAANYRFAKPETALPADSNFARRELERLGKFKRSEGITAIVVVLSVLFWATTRFHHLPSFLVGMLALAVFAWTGIVQDKDVATGVSWTLLLFLGGIFSLSTVLQEYKITDWVATLIVPTASKLTFSVLAILVLVAVMMFLLRFLDPSGFIAIPVLFLPLTGVALAAHIPPLVLMAALILAAVPFWTTYQNIWFAMGESITAGQAFSAEQRVRFASVYALAVIVTLAISMAYWKVCRIL